jgi:hypothetical protein
MDDDGDFIEEYDDAGGSGDIEGAVLDDYWHSIERKI